MSSRTIKLDGVLNIARVEALHAEFEVLEKKPEPLIINASNVSRVDTAVLQLLVSLFRSLFSLNINVEWAGVSEEFKAAAKLLGLESELKLV
tara:strand:- start:19204 stop:19479 length:276 start_codon:yes stop_codon:yes gene_type:complete